MFKRADILLFAGIFLFFAVLIFGMGWLQRRMPPAARERMDEMVRKNEVELDALEALKRERDRQEKVAIIRDALREAVKK
jgi:hypothetical protein